MMMKSRKLLIISIALLMLGIAFFAFSPRKPEPLSMFPASASLDCAPWDGAAFTVQIPWQGGDVIDISIWQAPEIQFPVTFNFPDDTGQVGNVILTHPSGLPNALTGEVWLKNVSVGNVIQGRFNLKSEGGGLYQGQFAAQWSEQITLCG